MSNIPMNIGSVISIKFESAIGRLIATAEFDEYEICGLVAEQEYALGDYVRETEDGFKQYDAGTWTQEEIDEAKAKAAETAKLLNWE